MSQGRTSIFSLPLSFMFVSLFLSFSFILTLTLNGSLSLSLSFLCVNLNCALACCNMSILCQKHDPNIHTHSAPFVRSFVLLIPLNLQQHNIFDMPKTAQPAFAFWIGSSVTIHIKTLDIQCVFVCLPCSIFNNAHAHRF